MLFNEMLARNEPDDHASARRGIPHMVVLMADHTISKPATKRYLIADE